MKLSELVHLDNNQIVRELIQAYPNEDGNKVGYFEALNELKTIQGTKQEGIILVTFKDDEEETFFDVILDVDGKNWSMSFVPWHELVNCEVVVKDCDLTPTQMAAHVIWEMTFFGYSSQEVEKEGAEIFNEIINIKEEIDLLGDNPTEEELAAIGVVTKHGKED